MQRRGYFKSIFRLPFLLAQHLGGQLIFLDWTLLTQLVGPRSMKTQLDFYLSHNKHTDRIMEGAVRLDHGSLCGGIVCPVVVLRLN